MVASRVESRYQYPRDCMDLVDIAMEIVETYGGEYTRVIRGRRITHSTTPPVEIEDGSRIRIAEIVDPKGGYLGSLEGYSVNQVLGTGEEQVLFKIDQFKVTDGQGNILPDTVGASRILDSVERILGSQPPQHPK